MRCETGGLKVQEEAYSEQAMLIGRRTTLFRRFLALRSDGPQLTALRNLTREGSTGCTTAALAVVVIIPQTLTLHSLPAEIRNMIYRLLLLVKTPIPTPGLTRGAV